MTVPSPKSQRLAVTFPAISLMKSTTKPTAIFVKFGSKLTLSRPVAPPEYSSSQPTAGGLDHGCPSISVPEAKAGVPALRHGDSPLICEALASFGSKEILPTPDGGGSGGHVY